MVGAHEPVSAGAPQIPFTGRIKSPEIYPRLAEPKHSVCYVSIDDETWAQMASYAVPPAEWRIGWEKEEKII